MEFTWSVKFPRENLEKFISPRSASRRDKVAGKLRFQKIFDQIKLFVEFWDKAAVFSTGIGLNLDLKFLILEISRPEL